MRTALQNRTEPDCSSSNAIETAPHRVHEGTVPETANDFFLWCCSLENVDKPRFHGPWNRAIGSRFLRSALVRFRTV